MRRNKLSRSNTKLIDGNLIAYDEHGNPRADFPAHSVHGAETTEFSLILKRNARRRVDDAEKELPVGKEYMSLIEKHGQLKLEPK